MNVALDKALPNGPWRARLTLVSGLEKRTAEATITFPEAVGAAPAVPVDDPGIPWWVIVAGAAFLLVLLLALALVLGRRRRRRERQPAGHRSVTRQ